MKYQNFFQPGMGTENVAPFLYNFCRMIRPQKILEIGTGYTTPFFIEALTDNFNILIDSNIDKEYLNQRYTPKLVCIDNLKLSKNNKILNLCKKYDFVDFINSNFQGKSSYLKQKYQNFDFVWFDCGGKNEYRDFVNEYWDLCSEYIIFHYTYDNHAPNILLKTILNNAKGNFDRLDIIEPHKFRQGSITILKKHQESKKFKNVVDFGFGIENYN